MKALTPDQCRVLAEEGRELARMADIETTHPGEDFPSLRIALAARRIAEIVMPQDLVYAPSMEHVP